MATDPNRFLKYVPGGGGAAPPTGGNVAPSDFYVDPDAGVRPPGPAPQASVPNQLDYSKFGQSKYTDQQQAIKALTDQYMGDERTKALITAMPGYVSGLQTAENPAGDYALVFDFAKVMDPIGAVQQGESKGISNLDSVYNQLIVQYTKELKNSGGNFRPEMRQYLRTEMRRKVDEIVAGHNQAREFYTDKANYAQVPAWTVVGKENLGAAWSGQLRGLAVKKRENAIREKGLNPAEHQDWIQNGPDDLTPPPGPGGPTPPGGTGPGALVVGGNADAYASAEELANEPPKAPTPGNMLNTKSEPNLEVNIVGGPRPTKEQRAANPELDAHWKRIELWEAGGPEPSEQLRAEEDKARADALRKRQDETALKLEDALPGGGTGGPSGAGDKERMLMKGLQWNLGDEAAGVANMFTNPLTPFESYRAGRDVEAQRDEEAKKRLGWTGTGLEIAGNMLSLGPVAEVGALTKLAELTQMAKAGAATSALAGWGEGRGAKESLGNAATYGTIGAVTAPLIPELGRLAQVGSKHAVEAPIFHPLRGQAPELAAASRAENVPLQRPMFDTSLKQQYGHLESSKGSSQKIRTRMGETVDALEAGKVRMQGPAPVENYDVAGAAVQSGAQNWISRAKATADRLYARARSLSGDQRFTPTNAIQEADDILARLRANPNSNEAEIAFVQRYRDDLAIDGGKNIDELRELRTNLRGAIDNAKLGASQSDARINKILDAAQADVTANLPRNASSAWRRADTYYRERQVHIDDVLEGFIKPNKAGVPSLSPEKALDKLVALAHPKTGDARRFGTMWRSLTNDEQNIAMANIVGTMGRPVGQPQAPFSTRLFKTAMSRIGPSQRRVMFGQQGSETIDNLLLLQQGLERSGGDMNIVSSGKVIKQGLLGPAVTGAATAGGALLGAGVNPLAVGAGAVAGLAATLGGSIARNLSARAMTNPSIARWLAEAPRAVTPTQTSEMLRRLTLLIARQPQFSEELLALKADLENGAPAKPKGKKLSAEDTR